MVDVWPRRVYTQYLCGIRQPATVSVTSGIYAPRLHVPNTELLVASTAHYERVGLAPAVRSTSGVARLSEARTLRLAAVRERIGDAPGPQAHLADISGLVQSDSRPQRERERLVLRVARHERVAFQRVHARIAAHRLSALGNERDRPYARVVPDERAAEHARARAEDVDAAVREPDDDPLRVDRHRRRDRGIRERALVLALLLRRRRELPGHVGIRGRRVQQCAVDAQELALPEPVRCWRATSGVREGLNGATYFGYARG